MADIEVTRTSRGFAVYGDEVTTDYGHRVRIYESSSAEAAKVWMNVALEEPNPHGLPAADVSVHMNTAQAVAIRDRLNVFIRDTLGYDDMLVQALRDQVRHLQQQLTAAADSLREWATPED